MKAVRHGADVHRAYIRRQMGVERRDKLLHRHPASIAEDVYKRQVQGRAAEPVHRRAGTIKINAQRFGRDLPRRSHGEHLAGLVEQKAARPQQHTAVIAAFLNGAAAHIDQLPRLRLRCV